MVFRFVVMPCLDEGRGLTATCASLGMFRPAVHETTRFVLVDNGSRDDTLAVMRAVADRAAPGSVSVVEEPERGYVPARRRGAEVVREVAALMRVPTDEALVLQVDADTTYGEGYCQSALKFDPLSASNIDPFAAICGGSGRPAKRVRVAQPGGCGGVKLRPRRGS